VHKLISKYIRLTSSNRNNNCFNYSRKINKYCFKLIRNKEKRFYKALVIFDEKEIIKLKRFLIYLEEDRNNLFICRKKFIALI